MITNQLYLSINDNISHEKSATCNSVPSIEPYNYISEYTPPRTCTQNNAMKARQIYSINNFYINLSSVRTKICHTIHNNSSSFLKSWQVGNAILPKQPDGDTARNLMKYTTSHYSVLLCTVAHLLRNFLKKYLIPWRHHYLIYYLRKFLRILILGYPASNTTINSSTSSCASNIWVTPFSSKSWPVTGFRIIILKPSDGKPLLSTIGHTDVLSLFCKYAGHTTNASKINPNISHNQPLSFYNSTNYIFHSNGHSKWNSTIMYFAEYIPVSDDRDHIERAVLT